MQIHEGLALMVFHRDVPAPQLKMMQADKQRSCDCELQLASHDYHLLAHLSLTGHGAYPTGYASEL